MPDTKEEDNKPSQEMNSASDTFPSAKAEQNSPPSYSASEIKVEGATVEGLSTDMKNKGWLKKDDEYFSPRDPENAAFAIKDNVIKLNSSNPDDIADLIGMLKKDGATLVINAPPGDKLAAMLYMEAQKQGLPIGGNFKPEQKMQEKYDGMEKSSEQVKAARKPTETNEEKRQGQAYDIGIGPWLMAKGAEMAGFNKLSNGIMKVFGRPMPDNPADEGPLHKMPFPLFLTAKAGAYLLATTLRVIDAVAFPGRSPISQLASRIVKPFQKLDNESIAEMKAQRANNINAPKPKNIVKARGVEFEMVTPALKPTLQPVKDQGAIPLSEFNDAHQNLNFEARGVVNDNLILSAKDEHNNTVRYKADLLEQASHELSKSDTGKNTFRIFRDAAKGNKLTVHKTPISKEQNVGAHQTLSNGSEPVTPTKKVKQR